ncbi:MAG: tetratricopeptide repeat protein [Oleiphilaceae bacterium]|nr:tetratricopeptide repeat protein [Oleiphilaceae bacterium]
MARIPAANDRTRIPCLCLALALWLFAVNVSAAEDAAQRGIEAFRDGQMEQAAAAFEQAMASSEQASASLRYNLGVVYYRLGRYRDAIPLFQSLISEPRHAPLAHYNLGLTYLALEQALTAAQSFERAYLLSSDETIAKLARRQLERLDLDDLFRGRAGIRQPWRSRIDFLVGYNDNPLLRPDRNTASGDAFAELRLVTTGYLQGGPGQGLRLVASGLNRQFREEDEQDSSVLSLALHYDWQRFNWRHSPGVSHSRLFDQSRDIVRHHTLHYDLERNLGQGRADLSVAFSRIETRAEFESQEGHQAVAGLGYRYVFGNHLIRGDYRFIRDRRNDFESGDPQAPPEDDRFEGFFISQSADRHQLSTLWRYRLSQQWSLNARLQYRESRFADPFEARSGGERFRENRLDRRLEARLGLSYRFAGDWSLTLRGSHTENDSTLNFYRYRRDRVSLGLGLNF